MCVSHPVLSVVSKQMCSADQSYIIVTDPFIDCGELQQLEGDTTASCKTMVTKAETRTKRMTLNVQTAAVRQCDVHVLYYWTLLILLINTG